MYCDFQVSTCAKWILVGEHAVIRGHGALVFPIPSKQLLLRYQASDCELTVECSGSDGAPVASVFLMVLDHSLAQIQKQRTELRGRFFLDSTFPVGVGMGASAAVCAALSLWYVAQDLIPKTGWFDFAKQLEHLFHLTSSGLDIIGVTANTGMYFEKGQAQAIQQVIQPKWYISSCQETGRTSQCIQQVQQLWQKDAVLGKQIDAQMAHSVIEARQALEEGGPDAIPRLAHSMNQAAACFRQWGLVSYTLENHMQSLREAGALAVKPTGSGGGGYVVSLWEKEPPAELKLESLI